MKLVIFTIMLFLLIGLFAPPSFAQTSQNQIPEWVKNNAEWWSKGLISDRDFASGLGFMVQSGIISVDNIPVDSEGTITIDDNLSLPKWIRNNAEWWASGAISDDDFKSGIQFMLKEEIVSFKEKPRFISDELIIPDQIIIDLYTATVYQELTTLILLDIKNAEIDIYDDARKNAWKEFDNTRDIKLQNIATTLESAHKQTQEEAVSLTKFLHEIKNTQTNFEYLAKMNDIPKITLEKESEIPLLEIDNKVTPDIVDDIISAYKDAHKSNEKTVGLTQSIISESDDELIDDFFTFGFENDGLVGSERIANEIIRIEAEETGDNSSYFIGSLEYIMINQLNINDIDSFSGMLPIADDPAFIILDDLINDDTLRSLDDDGYLTEEEWENLKPSDSNPTSDTDGLSDLPGLESDEIQEETESPSTESSSSDSSCDDCIWITSVQFIDNKAYPMFQFMVFPKSNTDPNCPNGTIGPNVMVSQSYTTVYHLDFDETGLTWNENTNNSCGNFGIWGDAKENYPITEDQGNFMKEKFNFDFPFESYIP